MTIYLDCDGTWIDLYGVENWLDYLQNENPYPYIAAKPLVNLAWLARTIHELQNQNIKIGIISWLSKNSSKSYNRMVTTAKLKWFKKHLPSVCFDEIHIIEYGTPKSSCSDSLEDILFDDEDKNRKEWRGKAYDEKNLIKTLRTFLCPAV